MHDEAGKSPEPHVDQQPEPGPDDSGIPALALGALDAGECERAEHEINTTPDGRMQYAGYAEAVGLLGLATPEARPRAELRDRILNAAGVPVDLEAARERRRSPAIWLGAVAAVLILALAGLAAYQWSQASDRADRIAELEGDLAASEARIAELEEAARKAGVYVNFEQPLVWRPFQIPDRPQGAWGYLIYTPDGQTGYLVIAGMPLEEGKVYQAWTVEDRPVSAGTLRTDESGMGFLILQHFDVPIQELQRVGITVEPPGGSPAPTSDPVAIAEPA
ncbi:MAG TPA: anti-sigma factor [Thermomicrobiales bacterium]|nr:anti-sigma factor [Thermomicrobiales bacterium]